MSINEFRGEYRFLSNFYPCIVEYEGMKFMSTENAYQAAKTLDKAKRKAFQWCSPGAAKKAGSNIQVREDWFQINMQLMEDLNMQKFSKREFKKLLLDTGDEELIEGNYWGDKYWGVDSKTGEGENHLGKLLMRIRDRLREKD